MAVIVMEVLIGNANIDGSLVVPSGWKQKKDGNAIWMYDPKVHTCDPDPIDLVHRFKLQVKKWIVYKSIKKQFIDAIEDPVYREMVSRK